MPRLDEAGLFSQSNTVAARSRQFPPIAISLFILPSDGSDVLRPSPRGQAARFSSSRRTPMHLRIGRIFAVVIRNCRNSIIGDDVGIAIRTSAIPVIPGDRAGLVLGKNCPATRECDAAICGVTNIPIDLFKGPPMHTIVLATQKGGSGK